MLAALYTTDALVVSALSWTLTARLMRRSRGALMLRSAEFRKY